MGTNAWVGAEVEAGAGVGEGVPGLGHIDVPLQGEERGVDPQALGQAVGVSGVDLFRKE